MSSKKSFKKTRVVRAMMTPKEIKSFIPEMQRLGVSEVARSKRGFLYNYLAHGNKMLTKPAITPSGGHYKHTWIERRNAFVERHLAQYKKNKTYRRKLALIAWAYNPN